MGVSNRETVLDSIKTTLESITTANGFNVTVAEVRRGAHTPDSFNQFPALALLNVTREREDFTGKQALATLHLRIFGYVKVDAPGDYTELDKLLADVETALMSRTYNSYRSEADVGTVQVYEGGAHDPDGAFVMEATVEYEYEMTDP